MDLIYSWKQLANQVEYYYTTLNLGHYRFYATFDEQIGNIATRDKQYPAIFMTPISSDHGVDDITHTFRIWVFDRLAKDRSNEKDIVSDTQQILNQIIVWFGPDNHLYDGMLIVTRPQSVPVNNGLLDFVAGWYCDITIEMQQFLLCQLPLDPNAPGPPIPCSPPEPLGFSGVSGFSGYSGVGINGTSGFSGESGLSGFSGYSGVGIDGTSGYSGYSGTTGIDGVSGYSGTSGLSGFSGYSGSNGANGTSGFSGYSGVSGFSGYSGVSGFSGYSGYSGYSGISGVSGVTTLANTITVTQSATPTLSIGTNVRTIARMTGLTTNVTNFSTNFTSTPTHGNMLSYEITDNGTARTLSWGAMFTASGTQSLPTTTVISTLLRVLFQYNDVTTTWQCIGVV